MYVNTVTNERRDRKPELEDTNDEEEQYEMPLPAAYNSVFPDAKAPGDSVISKPFNTRQLSSMHENETEVAHDISKPCVCSRCTPTPTA